MADTTDKQTFWSTLQKIVKQPDNQSLLQVDQQQQQSTYPQPLAAQQEAPPIRDFMSPDDFNKFINLLKNGDFKSRLYHFDVFVKRFDNVFLTEEWINKILVATYDLFDINKTHIEFRCEAFELLIQLIKNRHDKFESIISKNSVLSIISGDYDRSSTLLEERIFDDVELRLRLFITITNTGLQCNSCDFKLIVECLNLFLDNTTNTVFSKNLSLMNLFTNLLRSSQNNNYIDNSLQIKLTRYLYAYSTTSKTTTTTKENQDQEIMKPIVELIDILAAKLTSIESTNNVVLCLCDLVDLKKNENNVAIFNCMNKLFNGSMAYCALYAIINEIFDKNKINELNNKRLIAGALVHIKQVLDHKQAKLKNTRENRDILFLHELFVNTLVYLPNTLDAFDDEDSVRLIITLLIDFISLAYCRDPFYCLLSFNSKEFLIEATQLCFNKVKNYEQLLKLYADLLNLIEKKDVCIHKSSSLSPVQPPPLPQQQPAFVINKNQPKDNNDDFIFSNALKDKFYQIVYEFNHIDLLNDNTINNCIKHYLHEKFLPYFDNNWLENTKILVEKYFNSNSSYVVRRFCFESIGKKIEQCDMFEWKSLKDDIIERILIPICKYVHIESNIDLKTFIINRIIEFSLKCQNEKQINSIIEIFIRIISYEYSLSDTNNLNCVLKTVNSLIELFDYCLGQSFNSPCIQIYNSLISYLEVYYTKPALIISPTSTSTTAIVNASQQTKSLESLNTSQQQQFNRTSSQTSIDQQNMSLLAAIRREIFDFLLRLRCDEREQLCVMCKNDRRRVKLSRYLILSMKEKTTSPNNCDIYFNRTINLLYSCLEKEKEWSILEKVINELPSLLQNQIDLLKKSSFSQTIFHLVIKLAENFKILDKNDEKKENKKQEFLYRQIYPIISSLTSYHYYFDKTSQGNLLDYFCNGSRTYRGCLEALTVAIYEMHETNITKIPDILIKLSQISTYLHGAQGLLMLLSNISELPKLFESGCLTDKEYIAVAAIAIRHTDPLKFNCHIILLAHYVICTWFLKCKGEIRKSYASFTCKGLQQEVIAQLDYAAAAAQTVKASPKDAKSPTKLSQDENSLGEMRQKRVNTVDAANMKKLYDESPGISFTNPKDEKEKPKMLTENMKQFYKELVEVTTDFMSNYMFSNPINDYYDTSTTPTPQYNRRDSIKDPCRKGISRQWILNNCIAKISSVVLRNSDEIPFSHCRQHNDSHSSSNNSNNDTFLKSEQESFDDAIDDSCEEKSAKTTPKESSSRSGSNILKRRYKSGIDASLTVNNKEKTADAKLSKDDISLNSTNESSVNIVKKSEENNEICKPECWCNCLVEIKLSYPTKIVTFLVLVDRQIHDIDLSLFGHDILTQIARPNPLLAIENRRNGSLPRISESSVLQDQLQTNGDDMENGHVDKKHIDSTAAATKLVRKASFDSSLKTVQRSNSIESANSGGSSGSINTLSSLSIDATTAEKQFSKQQRGVTFVDEQQHQSNDQQQRTSYKKFPSLISSSTTSTQQESSNIDPREIFLQLFQSRNVANDKENVILIPEANEIEQSVKMLDYFPCYMIHKIGVIYVGKNQANDEKAILSNATGSARYKHFLRGLGNYIKLKDLDTTKFYPGGLERDGSAGDFALIWSDSITQIVFHVATLIPSNDNNVNFKKKHIGNDSTIIVYNESHEEYQFSFIKGEVNCICIEIEPLKSEANIVRVKTTNDMANHWVGHTEPLVINDNYLGLLVRKLAFHADLAVKVYRAQKDGNNYGGKCWERLKQINRIKKLCKDKLNNKESSTQQAAPTTSVLTDFTENI